MLMMKAVLPYMAKQKSGNVVNIGSGAALRGLPGSAAYASAKAGVVCLTQAVGDEVRLLGIRVNVICPGPVDTELFRKSELSEGMNSQILVMRGFNRW